MALFPRYPDMQPIGEMDLLDTELGSILGGEVVTLTTATRLNSATESAAADVLDGYLLDALLPFANRPAVQRASTVAELPLYLVDDGLAGYGTLFGEAIGTPAGLSTTGTNLGPHSSAASGKVTLWKPDGRYHVTVNAAAGDFVSAAPVAGFTPGQVLGFGTGADQGKLAHGACANLLANSGVGHFIELASERGGSLVTTPNRLVGATELFNRLEIDFHGGNGLRTV